MKSTDYIEDIGKKPSNPSVIGKPVKKQIKVKDKLDMSIDNYKQSKASYKALKQQHRLAEKLAKLKLKQLKLTIKIEGGK